MNNFAPQPETSTPVNKKIYKGGELVKFTSQFRIDNHIIESGVIVRVSGVQYSNFVDVRTNRGAKIKRIPVAILESTDKPLKKNNKYYKSRSRTPEEDCFWLNATQEAKQGRFLTLSTKHCQVIFTSLST